MKTKFTLFSIAASLAAVTSLQAQSSAVTKPVGYHTEKASTGFNLIGVNIGNAVAAAGDFDADSATDNDVDFTTLLTGGLPYTVQNLTTGDVAAIDGFTATTLTTTPVLAVTTGDTYEIREDQTIANLFGAANDAGFLTGGETVADVVWVPIDGGGFTQVYYSTGQGGGFPAIDDGWRFVAGLAGDFNADASTVVVPFYFSMFIERRGLTEMELVFVGHVRGDAPGDDALPVTSITNVDIITGFNPLNRVIPVGASLADMSIKDYLAGGTEAAGDVIWLPQDGGLYIQVYNSSGQGGGFPAIDDGLRYVGGLGGDFNADASGETFPSGALIQRRGGSTTVSIEVPSGLDI